MGGFDFGDTNERNNADQFQNFDDMFGDKGGATGNNQQAQNQEPAQFDF